MGNEMPPKSLFVMPLPSNPIIPIHHHSASLLKMAPHPSAQFVDAALNCKGDQFELSYSDPDQKLQIRQDLLSLIQEFPNFALSMDTFTHNDGNVVNLICAIATLHVSNSNPTVPITIWVHENYPCVAPMLFVDSSRLDFDCPISFGHPYVDSSSGSVASPYIHSWNFPGSNLRDLVRNVVNIFSQDHPFESTASHSGSGHPSYASKNEAINQLASMLHLDMTLARFETDAEVEALLQLQRKLTERDEAIARVVGGLELERRALRDGVRDEIDAADVLVNWLKVHECGGHATADNVVDLFKAADEESKTRLRCEAGDRALEDTIYALDEAVSHRIMGFEDYIRQVRELAREQFSYRTMLVKLNDKHKSNR